MTNVVLRAALPSIRLGLAAMLANQGHTLLREDEVGGESVVWVLDSPDSPSLDELTSHRYTDTPRAAVVLTDQDPAALAARLAGGGLRGWACLGRDADGAELDLAVRAADTGLVLLDRPTAAAAVLGYPSGTGPREGSAGSEGHFEPLTNRELQVLQLLAQGLPNKGIARALGVTENTAKFHVGSIYTKLGAASRTEAVTRGARLGLILL